MNNKDWEQARRILCIRLDQMGDVLMSTPAIRALKDSIPTSHITLLTSDSGAAVAGFIPELDNVIRYSAPWMKSSGPHHAEGDLVMVQTLQRHQFDAAVIFSTYSQSPLPAAFL